MKIAIVAHLKYPIAQPFAGGLEMHTHLLADGLIRRGHDVTMFAAKGSNARLKLRAVCEPTGEGPGDRDAQRRVDAMEDAAYRTVMNEVDCGDFDVVHNNSLHPRPLRMVDQIGIPMVTVLHTPPFDPLADAIRLAGGATKVVAVSRDLANHWRGLKDAVDIIPNGVDLSAFRAARQASTGRYAFWSGRIVPEKGLHFAIDAARAARMPFTFAGPRLDTDYWNSAIVPRLADDLTDLGHLAHADLAQNLARATVAVVSPCWDEPFGLVVAEALACGTPVAAFARGAIPSLLDPACGALARPDDSLDLARAIHVALACDRRACRAVAEARFDGERMIDRYENLYGRLIDACSALEAPATRTPSDDLDEAFA